jgi:hypothetical protein
MTEYFLDTFQEIYFYSQGMSWKHMKWEKLMDQGVSIKVHEIQSFNESFV